MFTTESQAKAEIMIAGVEVDALRQRIDALPSPRALAQMSPQRLMLAVSDALAVVHAAEAVLDQTHDVVVGVPALSMSSLKTDAARNVHRALEQRERARLVFASIAGVTAAVAVEAGYRAGDSGNRKDVAVARIMLEGARSAARIVEQFRIPGLIRSPKKWLRDCAKRLAALSRIEVREAA
jgi:hypothetical protein